MEYKSIEVRSHDALEIRRRVHGHIVEHIHRPFAQLFTRFDVRKLPSCHVHRYERVKVDVGIDADSECLLLSNRGLRGRRLSVGYLRGRSQCRCSNQGAAGEEYVASVQRAFAMALISDSHGALLYRTVWRNVPRNIGTPDSFLIGHSGGDEVRAHFTIVL